MAVRARKPVFDQVYIFGDSLSDSGMLADGRLTGIFGLTSAIDAFLPPVVPFSPIPFPPYETRFSNGEVFTQIAPELLGVPQAGVFSFAFGGARAVGVQTLPIPPELQALVLALPPQAQALLSQNTNLAGQVELFQQQAAFAPPADDSAAFITIGLNDLMTLSTPGVINPADPLGALATVLSLAGGVIDANLTAARTILEAGVQTVVFNALPAASFFPVGAALPLDLQAIGDFAVDTINIGIEAGAALLRLQGYDVRIIDLNAFTDEIAADFGTFGFLELSEPVLDGNGVAFAPNPDVIGVPVEQVAFFDTLHPTTNLHGVLAAFQAAALTSNTITRGAENDFILGGLRADLVLAGDGDDTALLGLGDDILFAGLGDDIARGGLGSDLIAGGAGADQLHGDLGADVLAGGAGDDTLQGGAGDDGLIDGLGNDRLFGGLGDDWFLYTEASILRGETGQDLFDGGFGRDTLVLLVTEATEAALAAGSMTLADLGLTTRSIERVIVTTDFGFDDVSLPGGTLGARLEEADLFGFL